MTSKPHLASLDEGDAIVAFIRDYWSADHVLARNRRLFDWQHRDELAGCYNFLIANDARGEIAGILGFIPTSRYDPALAEADTVWLTTWKVRPSHASGLGTMLLWAMSRARKHSWIGTVGLNAATRGIYDALGYVTGRLDRFFLLNRRVRDFQLAQVPSGHTLRAKLSGGTRLTRLDPADFMRGASNVPSWTIGDGPRKTLAYIVERYLRHPFYTYDTWLLEKGLEQAAIVTRRCEHEGAVALRVVDFMGSPATLAYAGEAFDQLLALNDAEYLDFYCSGLADSMTAAGLTDVAATDGLVLPAHFEPFERRNVDLLYSLKGPDCRRIVCKGDADQDRPNLLVSA